MWNKSEKYTEVISYKNITNIAHNALYIYYKQQVIRFWVVFKHFKIHWQKMCLYLIIFVILLQTCHS
jgi:hypothetical protein